MAEHPRGAAIEQELQHHRSVRVQALHEHRNVQRVKDLSDEDDCFWFGFLRNTETVVAPVLDTKLES